MTPENVSEEAESTDAITCFGLCILEFGSPCTSVSRTIQSRL